MTATTLLQAERQDAQWELRMVRQTVQSLFGIMQPLFPNFPNDYFVVDVETTGTCFHRGVTPHFDGDLITELGYCVVRNGQAQDYPNFILNWASVPGINHDALKERLALTKKRVEFDKEGVPTGKTYHMTFDKMVNEGSDPIEVLKHFSNLLGYARDRGDFFVAHNGYHFDATMLETHFDFWAKEPFKFGDNELFDTGMIEKGAQANLIPWAGDTVRDWSIRTYNMRLRGVRWSLDRDCVPRYALAERHKLDTKMAHTAGYDCYVTHLLFEDYKRIAAGECEEPPPYVRP